VLRYCFCYLAKVEWRTDLVAKFRDICEKQVVSANSLAASANKKKRKRKHRLTENGQDTETKHVSRRNRGPML
jgi:hypothetical protein